MKMSKMIVLLLLLSPLFVRSQSLEECQQAAVRNYPLIKQHELIEKTTDLTVENIGKGWLPHVSVSAQATYQSDVASWPEQMQSMMSGMGIDMKGLKKDQYRVGVDIDQTIYDGGAIGRQQAVAREQGLVQAAQTEVNLYGVRKRVNEMYFALLLLHDQIALNQELQALLAGNENKLSSMVKNGTAAECDLNNVRAERLNAVQRQTLLESQQRMLSAMLETLCGISVNHVTKPALAEAGGANNRPEMRLFDAQQRLADAQERALQAALMPRLSVFAQGFYGYPGYNMFQDMTRHRWSLNGMIGGRLTWNIGALYTHKNDKAKIQLQRDITENNRSVFLFNSNLEQMQQNEEIARYKILMADDDEIIRLRTSVRKAAESKLAHGIIDVNDLLSEINRENAARIQKSTHEIEMLKTIYDNKLTTNN
ncbi:MAG: TolC family protein [Muribaculaceae bacterium]|nr:TolC family protein [Muribaculaceae bacterium]